MQTKSDAPKHLWPGIQKLGLLEGVTSVAEYERLTTVGTIAADEAIVSFNLDCFDADAGETLHRLVFGEVHPWAGEYRRFGESVTVGGFPGADIHGGLCRS